MRSSRFAVVLALPAFALAYGAIACGGVDSVTSAPAASDDREDTSSSDGGASGDGGHTDAGRGSKDGGAAGSDASSGSGSGSGTGSGSGGGGGGGGTGGGSGSGGGIDAGTSGGSTVTTCAELLACCETTSDPSTCEILAGVGDDATCASLAATLCP